MKWMQVAIVATAMSLALAGCGGPAETSGLNLPEYQAAPATDSRSAADLLAASEAALDDAESVTLEGTTTSGDETLTAAIAFSGDDGSGAFSHSPGRFDLLMVDGKAWWKGDAVAYAGFDFDTAVVTRKIGGRWIVTGSSHPRLAPIDVPATRDELFADLIDPGPAPTRTAEQQIDGTEVVGVTTASRTLYLAADTMLPVRLTLTGDDGDGIGFSYDDVPKPVAPPADQIVDLADLR